jgi:phage baseplate assembly protein gpV
MSGRVELDRLGGTTDRAARLRGVYLAVVTSNLDQGSDSRARVKVRFPWLPSQDESHWARILAPMAGAERGTYFLPEVDDQVLVVFEHGEITRPIIVGGLWSAAQKPPQRNQDGKNDIRVVKSRSGHRLLFDDKAGAERLVLVDSTGKNKIVLDAGKDRLIIESGRGDIELLAPSGTVKLHGKSLKMTADGAIDGQGTTVEAAGKSLNLVAGGLLQIKGGSVALNPGGKPGGTLSTSAVAADEAEAVGAADQVRDQPGGQAAAGEGAPGGSAAAREQASGAHLPELAGAMPVVLVAAQVIGDQVQPGQSMEISAPVVGATSATYEVLDGETGEVIDSGPARVQGGRATAVWDSSALSARPQTSSVAMRLAAGGASTTTAPIPVAGRPQPPATPSPSSRLIDPKAPLPRPPERPMSAPPAAPGTPTLDQPGAMAAPTVDSRGRAADLATPSSAAPVPGAPSAAPVPSAPSVPGTPSAPDPSAGVPRGDRPRVGSAAVAAMEGDASGAAGALAGGQVGAAARGDASGAAGGGTAGRLADGDLRGAAAGEAGIDPRLAGADSAGDLESAALSDAKAVGRDQSGLAEAENRRAGAESRVEGERRHAESQVDVESRATAEKASLESEARGEVPAEVDGSISDAEAARDRAAAPPDPVRDAESRADSERAAAQRVADRPQAEAHSARSGAESRAPDVEDARDPAGAAAREGSRARAEQLGESESAARRAERTADDPDREAKSHIEKLDDE